MLSRAGVTDPISFPSDTDHRIEVLNGVVSAGIDWPLPLRQPTCPLRRTSARQARQAALA